MLWESHLPSHQNLIHAAWLDRNGDDPMSWYLGMLTTERDPVNETKAQRQEVVPHPHPAP